MTIRKLSEYQNKTTRFSFIIDTDNLVSETLFSSSSPDPYNWKPWMVDGKENKWELKKQKGVSGIIIDKGDVHCEKSNWEKWNSLSHWC